MLHAYTHHGRILMNSDIRIQRSSLCSEEEIATLVHDFYGRVRADKLLGPIFDAHIHDWDEHLQTMVRFWSSLLLGAGTYHGQPMPKHVRLPDLSAELFQRWLALFRETTDALPNRRFAERAMEMAQRIAQSLWFGYQINNNPDELASELKLN